MGPFQWLATRWTPLIEYRDYRAIEVEDIAWGSTLIGSRRGFLVGVPAGALFVLLIMGGVALSRLAPSDSAPAPRQGQPEAVASPAVTAELNSLREENRALKQQVTAAKAAPRQGQPEAVASPAVSAELNTLREENRALKQQVTAAQAAARQGQRDAVASQAVSAELNTLREENRALKRQVTAAKEKAQPKAQAVGTPTQTTKQVSSQPAKQTTSQPAKQTPPQTTKQAPTQPAKQATTRPAAPAKPSAAVAEDQVAQPIPSNCRQAGDCGPAPRWGPRDGSGR